MKKLTLLAILALVFPQLCRSQSMQYDYGMDDMVYIEDASTPSATRQTASHPTHTSNIKPSQATQYQEVTTQPSRQVEIRKKVYYQATKPMRRHRYRGIPVN